MSSSNLKRLSASGFCALVVASRLCCAQSVDPARWFLVGEYHRPPAPGNRDCFLVPITNAQHLAHARYLISQLPNLSKDIYVEGAVVAFNFLPTPDGTNRNWFAPSAPVHTWQVTKVAAFGDAAPAVGGYGAPGLYDLHPKEAYEWTYSGNGAFLNYQILTEFVAHLAVKAEKVTERFRLSWPDMGTNFTYVVETRGVFNQGTWKPVTIGSWPITTTNWIAPINLLTNSQEFRVTGTINWPY